MKLKSSRFFISAATGIIIFSFSILVYAFSTGITGRTQKASDPGCTCHAANPSSDVHVNINGPDTLAPGQAAAYSVTISGGPLIRAGTDIAVSGGTLNPVSTELQLLNTELTHKLPKTPVEGVVTYEFTYTAPQTSGEQTIYANGNSVNFNGNNSGDAWNFAPNKIIQIALPTGIEDDQIIASYKLEQNYPNPFNPSTTINYTIAKNEYVSLKVYDLLGNEITDLVNEEKSAGSHSIRFSASSAENSKNISSGVYFYILKAGNFSASRKFILLK